MFGCKTNTDIHFPVNFKFVAVLRYSNKHVLNRFNCQIIRIHFVRNNFSFIWGPHARLTCQTSGLLKKVFIIITIIITYTIINLAHVDVLHWSGWGAWSVCTVSCDTGQERRTRKCLYKGQLNDRSCDGSSQAIRTCNREPCAGKHIDYVIFKCQVLISNTTCI